MTQLLSLRERSCRVSRVPPTSGRRPFTVPRTKLRRSRKRAVCGFASGSTSGYGLRCETRRPRPSIGFVRMSKATLLAAEDRAQESPIRRRKGAFRFSATPKTFRVAARRRGSYGGSIRFDAPPRTSPHRAPLRVRDIRGARRSPSRAHGPRARLSGADRPDSPNIASSAWRGLQSLWGGWPAPDASRGRGGGITKLGQLRIL